MRGRAEWMVPVDDQILEAIRDEGNLTPQALAEFDVTVADYAGKRCKELARYGLLEQLSRGLYRLTDDGRAYLDEELDAGDLLPDDSRLH